MSVFNMPKRFILRSPRNSKKIRRALAVRWQSELPKANVKKTGLEEALEDVRNGRVSGPFNTVDELMRSLIDTESHSDLF